MLAKLNAKVREMAPEYDAIVNLAAPPRTYQLESSLTSGYELFDEYERIKRYELYSSLLTAHLAANHLSPDGYVVFKSELAAYNYDLVPKKTRRPHLLTFVANSTTTQQAMNLAENRSDEQIVWINAVVNVLMTEELISEKQRKQKKEMKRFENKLKSSATLLKYWATGDNRPENGSFVSFDTSMFKSGKVALPRYIGSYCDDKETKKPESEQSPQKVKPIPLTQ